MKKDVKREIGLKKDLIECFKKLGLKEGENIMVHAPLSSLGFVCGEEQVVIEVLIDSVDP